MKLPLKNYAWTVIKMYEEDQDLIEDVFEVEIRQAELICQAFI